jgi:hypothetical protein
VITLCIAIAVGTVAGLTAWQQLGRLHEPRRSSTVTSSPGDQIATAWEKEVSRHAFSALPGKQLHPLANRFSCCGIVILKATRRNNGAVLVAAGARPRYADRREWWQLPATERPFARGSPRICFETRSHRVTSQHLVRHQGMRRRSVLRANDRSEQQEVDHELNDLFADDIRALGWIQLMKALLGSNATRIGVGETPTHGPVTECGTRCASTMRLSTTGRCPRKWTEVRSVDHPSSRFTRSRQLASLCDLPSARSLSATNACTTRR